VWTIHQSVNGTTYYYNRATKKSQYEMPECFKTTEEVLEHPDWKEYRTAEGKKFYYNATNRKSCWQLPNEVKEYRIKLEEKRRKDREEGRVVEEEQLSEAEEAKRKFMALLRQKLIAVSTKWDSCIKLCEDDPRWQLLKISDKKKYFNEYVGELRKISDQEKRAKTEVNKNLFLKMLRENGTLTSESKMHRVAYDFLPDPRWRLLEEHDRENTFQAYLDELAQKEKDEALRNKRQACEAFRAALEADGVKHNAKWDDVRNAYKGLPELKDLHPYDRISTFIDYILEAEKKHEEEVAKERRLRERVNRIAFRTLLRDKLLAGELNYKMRWREFCTEFRAEKTLLGML
jgi:pre-mRNA-processing factor 40